MKKRQTKKQEQINEEENNIQNQQEEQQIKQEEDQQISENQQNDENDQEDVHILQLSEIQIDDGLKLVLKKELEGIRRTKYGSLFAKPVQWKEMNLLDYPKIIKQPMDFTTMIEKLIQGEYENMQQFTDDYTLIFDNCKKYNGHTSDDYFWKAADSCKFQLMKKLDICVNEYLNPTESSEESSSEIQITKSNNKQVKKSQNKKQPTKKSRKQNYDSDSEYSYNQSNDQNSNNSVDDINLDNVKEIVYNKTGVKVQLTDIFMQPIYASESDLQILENMRTKSWVKYLANKKVPKTFLKPMIAIVKQNIQTECIDYNTMFSPYNLDGTKAILQYISRTGGESLSNEVVPLSKMFDNMITVKLTDVEGINLERIKYKDDEDVSSRMYKKITFDPLNSYRYTYRITNQYTFNSFILQYIVEKQYEIVKQYEHKQMFCKALTEQCNTRANEIICWCNIKRMNSKNNKYSLINQQLEQIGDYVCKQGLQMKFIKNNQAKSQYWNKIKKIKIEEYLNITRTMVQRIQDRIASFKDMQTPRLLDMGQSSLRPYQFKGMKFMLACTQLNYNCLLADDLGLGKTLQTLALLAQLAQNGIQGQHLIIVPSTLIYNWEQEIRQWCPWINLCIYYGSKMDREKIRQGWNQETHNNVILTSYNIAVKDLQFIKRKIFYYLILDEAHLIRNQKSKSWNALMSIQAMHKLLISGTPISNSTDDIYSLLNFALPELFNKKEEFNQLFAADIEKMANGEYGVNHDVAKTLHSLLRPFLLRRLKSEVEKELPEKTEYIVPCQLSRSQKYLYYEFMNAANNQLAIKQQKYLSVMNILTNLRRICNHPKLLQDESSVLSYTCNQNVYSTDSYQSELIDYQVGNNFSYRLYREIYQYMDVIKQYLKKDHRIQQYYEIFQQIIKRNQLQPLQYQHRKVFCVTCNQWHNSIIEQQRLSTSSIYQQTKIQKNIPIQDIQKLMYKIEQYQNYTVKQRQFLSQKQLDYNIVRSSFMQSILYYKDLIKHFYYQVQSCKIIQRPGLLQQSGITNLDQVPDEYFINQFNFAYQNPLPKRIINISNFQIERNNIDCIRQYKYQQHANPFTIESTHSFFDYDQVITYDKLNLFYINDKEYQCEENYQHFVQSYPYTLTAAKLYHSASFDEYDIGLVNQLGQKVLMPTYMYDQTQTRYITGVEGDLQKVQDKFNEPYPNFKVYCKTYLEGLALALNIRYMKCYKVGGFYQPDHQFEQYYQQQIKQFRYQNNVEIQIQNQVRGTKSKEQRQIFHPLQLVTPLIGITSPSIPLFTQQQQYQHVNPTIPNYIGNTMGIPQNTYQINQSIFTFSKKLSPFQFFTPNKCYFMNNITDINDRYRQTQGFVYHTQYAVFQPQKHTIDQFIYQMKLNRYFLNQQNDLIKTSGKMQVLQSLLSKIFSDNEKALIFTQSTSMLNLIELFIQEQNYSYYRMDGSTQPKQRQYLVNSFNNSQQVFVFIMTTRTGGIGLNLTGANNVIFYDCDWNPQIHQQATDRVHRINQVRKVKVYTLVSEFTVEENIVRRATQKRHLEKLVLTDGGFLAEYFTNKQEYKQGIENRFSKQNTKLELIYNKLVNETALKDRLADVIEFYDNEEDKIAGQKLIQEVEGDVNEIEGETEQNTYELSSQEIMAQINIYQTLSILPAIYFAAFQENYNKVEDAVFREVQPEDCKLPQSVIDGFKKEEDIELIKKQFIYHKIDLDIVNQGIRLFKKKQQQIQSIQGQKTIYQQDTKVKKQNLNIKLKKIYWEGQNKDDVNSQIHFQFV